MGSTHNPDQPLNQAIITGRDELFASTPLILWQPRTAISWQFAPNTVLRTGFGVFSDLLPGSIVDSIAANPPYINTFQGGLLGQAGGLAIAPGVPNSALDATVAANQAFLTAFSAGFPLALPHRQIPKSCLPPVALTAIPDGQLRAPYFPQWSFAVERQLGNTGSLRAQYVGTRAVNQPYSTQVNGYQTVCAGCFRPFPYRRAYRPALRLVTQFATGANSHYNGLQLTAEKRIGHGLQVRVELYVEPLSGHGVERRILVLLVVAEFISPLPGMLGRQYGNCDYDIRHNVNANYVYELPVHARNSLLAKVVNGWQLSGTFSVTAACLSRCRARRIRPTETASYRAAVRSSPVSAKACHSTGTIRSQE